MTGTILLFLFFSTLFPSHLYSFFCSFLLFFLFFSTPIFSSIYCCPFTVFFCSTLVFSISPSISVFFHYLFFLFSFPQWSTSTSEPSPTSPHPTPLSGPCVRVWVCLQPRSESSPALSRATARGETNDEAFTYLDRKIYGTARVMNIARLKLGSKFFMSRCLPSPL